MLDIAEYNALVLWISLPLIQTGSKASHIASDCARGGYTITP